MAERSRGSAPPGTAPTAQPRRAADIAAEADGQSVGTRDPRTANVPGQSSGGTAGPSGTAGPGGTADPAGVVANGNHRAADDGNVHPSGAPAPDDGSAGTGGPAGADSSRVEGETTPRRGASDPARAEGDDPEPGRRPGRRATLAKGGKLVKAGADALRSRVASAVWVVAVLAAGLLAVAALLVALDANQDNVIVTAVIDAARVIDGPFWRIFEFTEENSRGREVHDRTKEVLVNWGLAAVAFLVAGRVLDRIIRP